MELSPQEIAQLQGTRKSEIPPWESFSSEMEPKISPELQEQIKRYEERVHERNRVAEEELARQKELSNEVAKAYCFVTKEEYEDLLPRVGRIMHSSIFLHKLKECGLNCWYAEHSQPQKLKLIVQKGNEEIMACWVQAGYMIEYSWMNFDAHNVPLDERRRGWRTCLMQIFLKQLLTEEQIIKAFGRAEGPVSERYNSLFYEVRNKRLKGKE
jgi:hypothetical protein